MAFRKIGANLTRSYRNDFSSLAEDLARLKSLGPDFVEIWPELLGLVVAGELNRDRTNRTKEILLDSDLSFTVHAPLEINLMDLRSGLPHRETLAASVRFAGDIGAEVVVCHAGQRHAGRDALTSFKDQLAAEREALREAGDLAGESDITIAVENHYPELPVVLGDIYDYSARPSELAEMVSGLDHPSVAVCLDTGHAALSAAAFGFDLFEECAAAAPLVRHVHLQDNFQKVNLAGEPPVSEHRAFGLGDLHLPPGSGTIPLVELFERINFPQDPSCCAELSDEFAHLAGEALRGARAIARRATREPIAS
ncbi:MAG: sugar phosphate isomerase/epimerase family protein [Rubrobacteraceae bacterium]